MSRFGMRKSGKTSLRAALLAAATVAALALGGLRTEGASATVECTGANIIGEGSSLQRRANVNVWIPAFEGEVCNKEVFPKVEFRSQGSGAGLKAWGALGGAINRERQFIATDEAPTAAQIESIKKAAGGGNVLVIPVAQTAIAVVVNPPSGCTLANITNSELERVFRGVVTKWSELENAEGATACASALKRVVHRDGSGTTYQFKNYLGLINTAGLPCTVNEAEGQATWKELAPILNPETGAPNTGWPESCTGKTLTAVVRPEENGDGAAVRLVNATPGSIGYAALPASEVNEGRAVKLQNNGLVEIEEATYAEPRIAGVGKGQGIANCAGARYVVPTEGRRTGTGLDVDWSQVFGANLGIGGTSYPLCTLTYDLAFHGYEAAGFSAAQAMTVRDYVDGYIVLGGQTALSTSETNYAPLPETIGLAGNNVIAAARFSAGLISP
jgi:ABC-type phosphate transport system substrate-binding protein